MMKLTDSAGSDRARAARTPPLRGRRWSCGTELGRAVVATVPAIMCIVALAQAQVSPGLAGNWTLAQNDAGGRGGRGGGIPGVPLATEMRIKTSPTEVTIDTNTGSAQAIQTAVYRLDGSETNVPGPLGWTNVAKASTKNSTLVVSTVRSLEGPNGPVGAEIVDVYSVAGDVLTLERTQGRNKQKLVYNRQP